MTCHVRQQVLQVILIRSSHKHHLFSVQFTRRDFQHKRAYYATNMTEDCPNFLSAVSHFCCCERTWKQSGVSSSASVHTYPLRDADTVPSRCDAVMFERRLQTVPNMCDGGKANASASSALRLLLQPFILSLFQLVMGNDKLWGEIAISQ